MSKVSLLTIPLIALACSKAERSERLPAASSADTVAVAHTLALEKPWSDASLSVEAQRYLHDGAFRRSIVEAALTSHENVYARTRLSGYGLTGRGWEMLPEWTPIIREVDQSYVEALRDGAAVTVDDEGQPLWDGVEPTNMSEWIALGRRVFYSYPLRSEVFAEHSLRSVDLSARVGLQGDDEGSWPGVVAFKTIDGAAEIGITCALCHVAIEKGRSVEGRARRDFDYGEMRLAYYRDTGAFLDEDLKGRMAGWGPGRADITQDDDEDPVAIVDLWGVRDHDYLTQSGTIRHLHPAALAIRQETQLLHANHERVRPPRELAWALAMYVYSLTPPVKESAVPSPQLAQGKALFEEHCQHCHRDPNYGGLPVAAESIGTDPVLARGKARGTGLYRPAPLTRVLEAGPYLHDGSVASLDELLDPARSVPGHMYGTSLALEERAALVAFMATL